jgi:hypothetical protein
MPTLGEIDRHGEIQAVVRKILETCVQRRGTYFDDNLDNELLDRAASAQTGLLLLDSLMKFRGGLSPPQATAYAEQRELLNACLVALQIEDPYEEAVN